MGEYVYATIYKPVHQLTPFSNKFDKMAWDLYKAGDDYEKIEKIYRNAGFVTESGMIFDLYMNFIWRNETLYQTNRGVFGVEELPNLSLAYKYCFHDFWLSMLKPSEMNMNENDFIETEISGKELRLRFILMSEDNKENKNFLKSDIFKHYHEKYQGSPSIKTLVSTDDIVQISVGHIYYNEEVPYRESARKEITKQRKKIASLMEVRHWRKTI